MTDSGHDRISILIKGAGDLASGVAVRLFRCGFPVVMTELAYPLAVRRSVSFAQAIFDGTTTVEGISAQRATRQQVSGLLAEGRIPVLVDPKAGATLWLRPAVLIDAIMAKTNTGTQRKDAPFVLGLGPGFCAGRDCHAVVETNRGHDLGRVIWRGSAQPDTGQPGLLPGDSDGATSDRILRASAAGTVHAYVPIGAHVTKGDILATLHTDCDDSLPLHAPFDGTLRGIVHPTVTVHAGMKIGDLDPRGTSAYCFTVSDKSLAIGGGVLEAILADRYRQNVLGGQDRWRQ